MINLNGDSKGQTLTWQMIVDSMSKFGDIDEGDRFEVYKRRVQGGKVVLDFRRVEK